nr:hypothetical protein BaRGS_004356 [Batillaria attramentaria]
MQWKGPYVVEAVVGINDYKVQVNNKVKAYHANLLKKYVEREHPDKPQTATVACLSAEEELDDEKLFDLNEVRRKERIADVKLGPKLTQAQQDELKALTVEYDHRFTPDPGTTDTIQHEVNLTSDKHTRCEPYPLPYHAREQLKKDIQVMLDVEVIRDSKSPYASPVVVAVRKPDGSNRVCVDYRKLNKVTVTDCTLGMTTSPSNIHH